VSLFHSEGQETDMPNIQQTRITLDNLQVSPFASKETLCFTATVMFDGVAVATANNAGRGGATFFQRVSGKITQFAAAERFARSLPMPDDDEDEAPKGRTRKTRPKADLEYLVHALACDMDAERMWQAAFKRDMRRVVFITGGKVQLSPRAHPRAPAAVKRVYGHIRTRYPDAVILNELPSDQALELYKRGKAGNE
jgi:hypothetical protein